MGECEDLDEDIDSDYVEASVLDGDFKQWTTEEGLRIKLAKAIELIQKLNSSQKESNEIIKAEKEKNAAFCAKLGMMQEEQAVTRAQLLKKDQDILSLKETNLLLDEQRYKAVILASEVVAELKQTEDVLRVEKEKNTTFSAEMQKMQEEQNATRTQLLYNEQTVVALKEANMLLHQQHNNDVILTTELDAELKQTEDVLRLEKEKNTTFSVELQKIQEEQNVTRAKLLESDKSVSFLQYANWQLQEKNCGQPKEKFAPSAESRKRQGCEILISAKTETQQKDPLSAERTSFCQNSQFLPKEHSTKTTARTAAVICGCARFFANHGQ